MDDILIRGMDKPHNCFQCDLSYLRGERLFCHVTKDEVLRHKIASDCPIQELPEHGDLIDVSKISLQEYEQAANDALHNGKGSILYDCGVLAGARAITQLVRRAPVVIPSNKEGAE